MDSFFLSSSFWIFFCYRWRLFGALKFFGDISKISFESVGWFLPTISVLCNVLWDSGESTEILGDSNKISVDSF